MLVRCLFHTISTSNFIVISKKKLTTEKMLRTVREVADAENGSVFLNMEFNGSAKSTEKALLLTAATFSRSKFFCHLFTNVA